MDPDSAYDLLRDLAPGVDIADRIIGEILDSINETKEYLPDGGERLAMPAQTSSGAIPTDFNEQVVPLEDLGNSLAFIIAEATLANSGRALMKMNLPMGLETSKSKWWIHRPSSQMKRVNLPHLTERARPRDCFTREGRRGIPD